MSLTERTGFFAEYFLNLRNSLGDTFDNQIGGISACHDDFERMAFIEQLDCVRERDAQLLVSRDFTGKNAVAAADYKQKGNLAFKGKKWLEAMVLYTKSFVALPEENVAERAIVLANRSATLYHLERYDETLIDVKRAMDLGYPKDLIYKLHDRRARCHMAKKAYPNTITAFQKFITSLDDSALPADKRAKMTLDAMTMMKMLEKDARTAKQAAKQKKKGIEGEVTPTLAIPDEKPYLSASVRFDQNREEGRFARAATDIKVGDEILVERPQVAVLLAKYAKTHCEHCFVRTAVPLACPRCADVVFCSEKCQQLAAQRYHQYECGVLPTIRRSGASVNCHMALRLIANKPLDYYLAMRQQLSAAEMPLAELQRLPEDDYRRVAYLVRHEAGRSASNFFHHALMARFLLKCLLAGQYFGEHSVPSAEDLLTVGGLLLRNLQFVQFNTHEVAELQKSRRDGNERTAFIGGALYATLALFNHSCDPGIVRYFRGTTIHINTVRPLEAGLQISENYGPMYTQEKLEDRKARLRELYWFDCSCDACLENWPTFDKLPVDVIRFRCDAPNKCSAVIEVPPTVNEFMVKCLMCGESTNIFKGLKVMQDTEMMTRTAKRLYDAGEYSKALHKFVDLLKIMYEVLAPPFADFCECQQHLKDCFLHFGNSYDLD